MRLLLILCLCLPAVAIAAPGEPGRRIAAAQKAVEAAPTDPAAYEALGRLQLAEQDTAGAVGTFERLVAQVPSYNRGEYRLAFALRKAGRYDEAAIHYRSYIERVPVDPDARFGLATTLEELGQSGEALAAYRAYVELERRPSEQAWVEKAQGRIRALERGEVEAPAEAPAVVGSVDAPSRPPPGSVDAPTVAAQPAPPPAPPAARPATADGERVAPTKAAAPLVDGPAPTAAVEAPEAPRVVPLVEAPNPAVGPESPTASRVAPTAVVAPLVDAPPLVDPDEAFRRGDYDTARVGYAVRLAQQPDAVALRYRHALAAALAGRLAEAERSAALAVALDPGNPAASDLAVIAHARQPGTPASVAIARQALRDGRLRTAATLAEAALSTATEDSERAALFLIRARAAAAAGRAREAVAALKSAAALADATPIWWREFAEAASAAGDDEEGHRLAVLASALDGVSATRARAAAKADGVP